MRLEWTFEAIADVETFRAHIAPHNPVAADHVAKAIEAAAARLTRFPELGRALPALDARVLLETRYRYKLVYEVEVAAGVVRVLRVFHPRQNRP